MGSNLKRVATVALGAFVVLGAAGCGRTPADGSTAAGPAERSSQSDNTSETETKTYTREDAQRWLDSLADVSTRVDLGRDPTDLLGFLADGGRAIAGRIAETPRLVERSVGLPGGDQYGGTDEAGTNGEQPELPRLQYLVTTLVAEDGQHHPLEFQIGIPMPDDQGDEVAFAPPEGTRIMVAVMGSTARLAPQVGFWTVVETDDGGLAIGGQNVVDRTKVNGISRFDALLEAVP